VEGRQQMHILVEVQGFKTGTPGDRLFGVTIETRDKCCSVKQVSPGHGVDE